MEGPKVEGFLLSSPKGSNKPAQGNALGLRAAMLHFVSFSCVAACRAAISRCPRIRIRQRPIAALQAAKKKKQKDNGVAFAFPGRCPGLAYGSPLGCEEETVVDATFLRFSFGPGPYAFDLLSAG
jgi:hypothetical protein